MMAQLTTQQKRIHELAKIAARNHARSEWEAIEALMQVYVEKVHKSVDRPNLYTYAVEEMKLSEGTAYAMAAIAKRCLKIPEIMPALKARKVTANKLSRMLSAMTKDNARELLEFASRHTTKEVDLRVASINPKAKRRTNVRAVAGNRMRIAMDVSVEEYELICRARELLAAKAGVEIKDVVMTSVRELVERRDPVAKAERAKIREFKRSTRKPQPADVSVETDVSSHQNRNLVVASAAEPTVKSVVKYFSRTPIPAHARHAVHLRDGGRCTFIGQSGHRCESRHALHLHHIIEVSRGGSNEPENLVTICSHHHELIHQLSLPIEGQMSWIREPTEPYVA